MAALCLAGPGVQSAAAEDPPTGPTGAEAALALAEAALATAAAVAPVEATIDPGLPAATEPAAPSAPVEPPPAPEATAAQPEPTPESVSAPQPEPELQPPAEAVQGAQPEPAPAPASVAAPEPPPAPAAVAVQAQPANVSVSIRLDSPGENGAVTQVNAALAEAAPQYQVAAPQYHAPTSAPTPAGTSAQHDPPAEPEPGWSWTWSCGDTTSSLLPNGLPAGAFPETWRWNWNWNCGPSGTPNANSGENIGQQYHAGVTQYQPTNINVSIRIGSPGNDGAVTQANVAVAVIVPAPPALTVVAVAPQPAPPAEGDHLVVIEAAASASAPAVVAEVTVEPTIASGLDAWIVAAPALPTLASGGLVGFSPPKLATPLGLAAAVLSPVYRPGAPAAAAHLSRVQPRASAVHERPAKRPTPKRRPLPQRRTPVLAAGLGGAAPAGGGGDGGWPLLALLLMPFALALVDGAGRTVRDVVAPAAAELSARRDRPG